jgi:hypothetical protein
VTISSVDKVRAVKLLLPIYTNLQQRYYDSNTKSLINSNYYIRWCSRAKHAHVQSADSSADHLLGGDVNPDFDSWEDISSFETYRFFDTDGLSQCSVRVFGCEAFTSSIRVTDV